MDNSIRGLLSDVLRSLVDYDYPDKWPQLLPVLVQNVQSGDKLRIYNALVALRKVCKVYEYRNESKRAPLDALITQTFPLIQGLLGSIKDHQTLEAALVIKVCLKIFNSCTRYNLPMQAGGLIVVVVVIFSSYSSYICRLGRYRSPLL